VVGCTWQGQAVVVELSRFWGLAVTTDLSDELPRPFGATKTKLRDVPTKPMTWCRVPLVFSHINLPLDHGLVAHVSPGTEAKLSYEVTSETTSQRRHRMLATPLYPQTTR
jgi:hypothetical protein